MVQLQRDAVATKLLGGSVVPRLAGVKTDDRW